MHFESYIDIEKNRELPDLSDFRSVSVVLACLFAWSIALWLNLSRNHDVVGLCILCLLSREHALVIEKSWVLVREPLETLPTISTILPIHITHDITHDIHNPTRACFRDIMHSRHYTHDSTILYTRACPRDITHSRHYTRYPQSYERLLDIRYNYERLAPETIHNNNCFWQTYCRDNTHPKSTRACSRIQRHHDFEIDSIKERSIK